MGLDLDWDPGSTARLGPRQGYPAAGPSEYNILSDLVSQPVATLELEVVALSIRQLLLVEEQAGSATWPRGPSMDAHTSGRGL